ncbi:cytochrome P450 71A1-like [Cucumis melo var. makuwa]|uniref:Cytochrome P450 71A1-like n=2 Tax=Cucumis melo TaxID=3656 RepID=A0A1S3AYH8_CUCME|nr:phenylacetaldehyde oxime monooxygenase CYP71AN24-like [Cucumis melo]KAA0055269.1 cytochrome P450 71A1-like [Cucumis melo var. makuwa]TYJ99193.1 cytochrome P450 71A1-like [Cucumis melo var. makuwa]
MDQFNLLNLSLFFILFLLFLKLLFKPRRGNLPPSPPKLPIIGNLHQLGRYPHRSLQDLSKKYGSLMFLQLGSTPTLVVSSADMVREIFKNHDITFSNRPKSTAANLFFYGYKDVGFSPYGEYWRGLKKICTLELLSQRRVQGFQYVREEEVEILVSKVHKARSEGVSVNLSDLITSTSNNIVSRCIFGEKFEDENGKSRFGELTRKMAKLVVAFSVGDFFPAFGWVDNITGLIGKLKETSGALDAFLEQFIAEHKTKKKDDFQSVREDFVDILLQVQQKDDLGFEFTQESLKSVLEDMFIAGTDTTASVLEWTIAELARNPTMMKKAQEEVRKVVGKKTKIDDNDILKMEYLKCIIKESLRVHPPAPLLLPRETSEMVKLGGYCIPSKTRVFFNVWAIQRDPNIWENPEQFIPDRFMNNPIDFKGQDCHCLPFGAGRRICPGMNFAFASIEYVLANLLQWFDWKLADDNMMAKDMDMSEDMGIALVKKHPIFLKPITFSN